MSSPFEAIPQQHEENTPENKLEKKVDIQSEKKRLKAEIKAAKKIADPALLQKLVFQYGQLKILEKMGGEKEKEL